MGRGILAGSASSTAEMASREDARLEQREAQSCRLFEAGLLIGASGRILHAPDGFSRVRAVSNRAVCRSRRRAHEPTESPDSRRACLPTLSRHPSRGRGSSDRSVRDAPASRGSFRARYRTRRSAGRGLRCFARVWAPSVRESELETVVRSTRSGTPRAAPRPPTRSRTPRCMPNRGRAERRARSDRSGRSGGWRSAWAR